MTLSYITPHKITLLHLIRFQSQLVSTDSLHFTLLKLIVSCVKDAEDCTEPALATFVAKLKQHLSLHGILEDVVTDKLMDQVGSRFNGIPIKLHPALPSALQLNAIDTPDALMDFIKSAEQLVEREEANEEEDSEDRGMVGCDTLLQPVTHQQQPQSFLAIFVRRCVLAFQYLDFEDVCTLLESFETYLHDQTHTNEMISADEAEKYLEEQTKHLTGQLPTFHQLSNLREKLQAIWMKLPNLVKTHYVRYLQSMNSGDYRGALESLHCYFDYASVPAKTKEEVVGSDTTRPSLYKYALLNLVALYAKFGYKKEALNAVREAIDAARNSKDHLCLEFAVSWLSLLKGKEVKAEPSQLDLHEDTSSAEYLKSVNSLNALDGKMYRTTSVSEVAAAYRAATEACYLQSNRVKKNTPRLNLMTAKMCALHGNFTTAEVYLKLVISNSVEVVTLTEEQVSAHCLLAKQMDLFGKHREAVQLLHGIRHKVPFGSQTMFTGHLGLLLLRRAIARDRINDVLSLLDQLEASCGHEEEWRQEIALKQSMFLRRRNRHDEAYDTLQSAVKTTPRPWRTRVSIDLQLELATLYLGLGELDLARPLVLDSLERSRESMWAEPLIHAKILLALHDLQEGSAIEIVECALKSVWPRVLGMPLHLVSLWNYVHGVALQTVDPQCTKAQMYLKAAYQGFEQLEDIQHMILCLHYLPDNPDEGINTLKAELLENEMKPSEGIFYFSTKDISVSLE